MDSNEPFIDTDSNEPPRLFNLAIQCLLRDESAVIRALQVIPDPLYASFFSAAFAGSHINILRKIVKIWPFHCLHMGGLSTQESYHDVLKAIIESFQVAPNQLSGSG